MMTTPMLGRIFSTFSHARRQCKTRVLSKLVSKTTPWISYKYQTRLMSTSCMQERSTTMDAMSLRCPPLQHKVKVDDYENSTDLNVDILVEELRFGNGFVCLNQCFDADDVANARELIHYYIHTEGKKATHFQGSDDATVDLQARVWNLFNKGLVFEKMVQHPKVMAIGENILGDDFQLGSVASNTLFPGGSGQEPHIDYPYWDYYEKKHWPVTPKAKEIPFYMNMQATVLLDDFTEKNGATGVVSGTQTTAVYPDADNFYNNCIRTIGKAGDVIVFLGLIHHAAMPNRSQESRTGLILQYLPKFIRPMEDIKRVLKLEVAERATPRMRRLLTLDYPYPAVLDEAEPVNSEGYKSDFNWKE